MSLESMLLTSVTVQITARCNLLCSHCAVESSPRATTSWSQEMVSELFNQLGQHTPILDLTGGEPMLEWDILTSFGRQAALRQMFWGLTTNGILLTDERIDELVSLDIYGIKVSMDGLAQRHDAVRGSGTFAKAGRAVERLVKKGVRVGVQTAVSRHNQRDIPQLISTLDDLGITTLILFPLMPLGRQAGTPNAILSGQSLKRFILGLKEISTQQMRIHMELPHCASLLQEHPTDDKAQCGAGYMLHYTAGGQALPCPVFPLSLGNLVDDPIDTLMRHAVMEELRSRAGIGPPCSNCDSFAQCGGGCRAMAYLFSGDLRGPDPYCWLTDESTT
ncbi:radical SAM protein [Thermodesulfobacteriota bacterium]